MRARNLEKMFTRTLTPLQYEPPPKEVQAFMELTQRRLLERRRQREAQMSAPAYDGPQRARAAEEARIMCVPSSTSMLSVITLAPLPIPCVPLTYRRAMQAQSRVCTARTRLEQARQHAIEVLIAVQPDNLQVCTAVCHTHH